MLKHFTDSINVTCFFWALFLWLFPKCRCSLRFTSLARSFPNPIYLSEPPGELFKNKDGKVFSPHLLNQKLYTRGWDPCSVLWMPTFILPGCCSLLGLQPPSPWHNCGQWLVPSFSAHLNQMHLCLTQTLPVLRLLAHIFFFLSKFRLVSII